MWCRSAWLLVVLETNVRVASWFSHGGCKCALQWAGRYCTSHFHLSLVVHCGGLDNQMKIQVGRGLSSFLDFDCHKLVLCKLVFISLPYFLLAFTCMVLDWSSWNIVSLLLGVVYVSMNPFVLSMNGIEVPCEVAYNSIESTLLHQLEFLVSLK